MERERALEIVQALADGVDPQNAAILVGLNHASDRVHKVSKSMKSGVQGTSLVSR